MDLFSAVGYKTEVHRGGHGLKHQHDHADARWLPLSHDVVQCSLTVYSRFEFEEPAALADSWHGIIRLDVRPELK